MDDRLTAIKRARLLEARQKESAPQAEESSGGQDFINSMALGSTIGEHLPLIGKPVARLGSMIGSGIQAATEAPFSDASFGDIYDRNMRLTDQAEAEQAAYDERSPTAQGLKTALASMTIGAMKQPAPAPRDPFVKPGGFAERTMQAERAAAAEAPTPGQFRYPADTAAEIAAAQQAEKLAARQAQIDKMKDIGKDVWDFTKNEAIEAIPYGRRSMRIADYLRNKLGR